MDENQTTPDVNNTPDSTTAGDSSISQQTSSDATAQDNTDAGASTEDPKTVPYDRFKEVNDTLKMTKQEIAEMRAMMEQRNQNQIKEQVPQEDPTIAQAKAQLKQLLKEVAPELGFVSQEELVRKERDQRLESTLSRLEKEWDGSKDPALKFSRQEVIDFALKRGIGDPESAFKILKEKEFMNYHIRNAQSKTQGIKTEGSDGSGSANAGATNDDLMSAIRKGDKNARMMLWKRQFQAISKK